MHGGLAANQALLAALKIRLVARDGVGYAVCAPFPYLHQVGAALAGSAVAWGAQNLSEHDAGPTRARSRERCCGNLAAGMSSSAIPSGGPCTERPTSR